MIHGGAVRQRAHEGFIARALYETGDPIHRPIEWTLFPAIGVGSAVFHFGQTIGIEHPSHGGSSLGTEGALINRTPRVAFDVDYIVSLCIDKLSTAHGAVRTNTGAHPVRFFESRTKRTREIGLRGAPLRVFASELPRNGPITENRAKPIGHACFAH